MGRIMTCQTLVKSSIKIEHYLTPQNIVLVPVVELVAIFSKVPLGMVCCKHDEKLN